MKLTLQPSESQKGQPANCAYPLVSIDVTADDLTISEVFDELVIPALIAFGYAREIIDEYITDNATWVNADADTDAAAQDLRVAAKDPWEPGTQYPEPTQQDEDPMSQDYIDRHLAKYRTGTEQPKPNPYSNSHS